MGFPGFFQNVGETFNKKISTATTGFEKSNTYVESNRDLLAVPRLGFFILNSPGGTKELPFISTELVKPRL